MKIGSERGVKSPDLRLAVIASIVCLYIIATIAMICILAIIATLAILATIAIMVVIAPDTTRAPEPGPRLAHGTGTPEIQ